MAPQRTPPKKTAIRDKKNVARESAHYESVDAKVELLVKELIGRVADRWTMETIETLAEQGEMRFTRLSKEVKGISQKMMTKTVRQMERDGLLTRKIHPVIPPRVEYKLTDLGLSLSYAFCSVWEWAVKYHDAVERARKTFDEDTRKTKA